MTEKIDDGNMADEENFAALLDSYGAISNTEIQVGDRLQGKRNWLWDLGFGI